MKHFTGTCTLTIHSLEYYAYHGVRNEERLLGGRYQVDCSVMYNATKAVVNDDISDALNYEDVVYTITECMDSEPSELIETLAFDIASQVIDRFESARSVTVRVRKCTVPIQHIVGNVQAEVTVGRDTK
jgi:7,8-dihydroneopterin aldolase/epimerase/oxygenase